MQVKDLNSLPHKMARVESLTTETLSARVESFTTETNALLMIAAS
jgi:hypothetical protein